MSLLGFQHEFDDIMQSIIGLEIDWRRTIISDVELTYRHFHKSLSMTQNTMINRDVLIKEQR